MANPLVSQAPSLQDDPVLRFFRQLEDPALFERVDNVPLFCKSTKYKKAPDGTVHKVEVTDADLDDVAGVMRYMEDYRGSLPVITPGHRHLGKDVPEEAQPPPWGFARWARRGHYTTPAGVKVPALLGTVYYSRTMKDAQGRPVNVAARDYPFRSVDYYPDTKQISGVALIRRDPELDLGLVAYGKCGQNLFCYASENTMPEPMTPPATPTATPPANPPEELDEQEAQMAHRMARHFSQHHPAWKFMCDQYAAAAGGATPGTLSPTNGGMPAAGQHPMHPMHPPAAPVMPPATNGQAVHQMQRNLVSDPNIDLRPAAVVPPAPAPGTNVEVAQYHRDMEALRQQNLALTEQVAGMAKRERLAQYQRAYEVASENRPALKGKWDKVLPQVENLTPEQYQAHLGLLTSIAPEAPTKALPDIFMRQGYEGTSGGQVTGEPKGLTESQTDQCIQYIRENPGADFTKARAALFPNK